VQLSIALQSELDPLVRALVRLEQQLEPDQAQLDVVDQRLVAIHVELQRAFVAIQDDQGPQILVTSTCFAPWPISFGEVITQLQDTTEKLRQERQRLHGTDPSV